MPPLLATSAEPKDALPAPSPDAIAQQIQAFLNEHREAAVLEDGKVLFDMQASQYRVSREGERCTLQLWSADRQSTRGIVAAQPRRGSLRLTTRRFGHTGTQTLVLVERVERSEPGRREPARKAYLRLLERVLTREFPEWQPEGFRTAMDLERSFGPAYARGTLVRGNEAWAVIGVAASESQAIIDGVLTLGILWLHHCRERSDGRRLFRGLRVVVPRGMGTLTRARLPWLNPAAAQWQLWELDERSEELLEQDPTDQGNLRTRLVHHPDPAAARERFAAAIVGVMALVPHGEEHRVEQRLRSPAELAFLLHGLEFARARISMAAGAFTQTLELTIGAGGQDRVLNSGTKATIAAHLAELFARRSAGAMATARSLRPFAPQGGIGTFTGRPAHARTPHGEVPPGSGRGLDRLAARERAHAAQQDPLFRAHPERWLESVLRENLAPLTRSLAPAPGPSTPLADHFADEQDPDTRGNRHEPNPVPDGWSLQARRGSGQLGPLIARFDPRFVYTQVPAIAGTSDRGMLDLLGITEDRRLAVIEIKASDDLQLPLQGLDYWIRVRHHHAAQNHGTESMSGGTNDLQQHGYFRGVELSPQPPRLFLVAPALHIHPATETVLRYLSPQVEWSLLALDERWRKEIRVVWRKSGGRPCV